MIDFLKNNTSAIISFGAMIVSLAAVFYTRINIKTQKYIETITTQRIKWIETLRCDLSEVITGMLLLSFCKTSATDYWEYVENVGFEDFEGQVSGDEFIARINALNESLKLKVNRIDLIQKIDLSILRLNAKGDANLIEMLDNLRNCILHEKYDKDKDQENIMEIRKEVAATLKREWEKVKQETLKGRLTNDKPNRRFELFP